MKSDLVKTMYVFIQMLMLIAISVCNAENQKTSPKDILSLDYYLSMANDKRSYSDIALVNLLCAKGLPGAENIEVEKSLSTLKQWAQLATLETEKRLPDFQANPHRFYDSEGYFRTLVLVTFLSRTLGIRYNPALINTPSIEDMKSTAFFRNSEDIFIHGLLQKQQGTCSSIPVLLVSVGRLMGYQLRLVMAKGHQFARWQDGKEWFNIEYNGNSLKCHPDDYYMKWPFEISKAELEPGYFLKSLSPTEEFASFLETRANCLLENKRVDEALTAFRQAYSLYPNHPYLKGYIDYLTNNRQRIKAEVDK